MASIIKGYEGTVAMFSNQYHMCAGRISSLSFTGHLPSDALKILRFHLFVMLVTSFSTFLQCTQQKQRFCLWLYPPRTRTALKKVKVPSKYCWINFLIFPWIKMFLPYRISIIFREIYSFNPRISNPRDSQESHCTILRAAGFMPRLSPCM